MTNLIKTDFYRLSKSKLFYGCLIALFTLSALFEIGYASLSSGLAASSGTAAVAVTLSSVINAPLLPFMLIVVLIAAASFSYLDFSGGYIKNIAGQVNSKSSIVISKFIVISFQCLCLMLAGLAGQVVGSVAAGTLVIDAAIPAAIGTFFIKWLLIIAVCSVLLFISNGLRSKTGAIIGAVVAGANVLSLLYAGVNYGLSAIGIQNVAVGDYLPSQLIGSVNVSIGTLVTNSIISGVVCIALFLTFTAILMNKKDIK